MPNQNNLQFRSKTPPRWVVLLALLGLCSVFLTATTSSQQESDSARRQWDKQFEEARANARGQGTKPKPAPNPAKPGAPSAAMAGDELIGLTCWRLRPATNDGTGEPRLTVEQRGQGTKSYRLERTDTETPFREGEMVRFSVETTRADNRYLYVIDREVYADKTMGEPYLIFPARTTPPGGNVIAAGKLVYVPAQGDPVPYFTLQRKRAEHVGEMLTLILSPEPLPLAELPASGAPLKLNAALVKQWEQQWGGPTERREARGGANKEWTKAEQEAERGQGVLAQGNPLPQTIYRVKSKASGRVVVTVPLKIAPSAKKRDKASRNNPELIVQLGQPGVATAAAFSPDGRMVLTNDISVDGSDFGTGSRVVRLWDVASGKELRRFMGHSSNVTVVAFSSDGRKVLTGSTDGTVRVWDVVTGKELRRLGNVLPADDVDYLGGEGGLELIAGHLSQDGRTALTGRCNDPRMSFRVTLRMWDVTSGKVLARFVMPKAVVDFKGMILSPNLRTMLLSRDPFSSNRRDTTEMWGIGSGNKLQRLKLHSNLALRLKSATVVKFAPDGNVLLTASENGTVQIWDVVSGKELRRLEGHSARVTVAMFAPDGHIVLTGSDDGTARIWDLTSGKELRRLGDVSSEAEDPEESGLSVVALSPDRNIVLTGSNDGALRLWDTKSGEELRRLEGDSNSAAMVAYALDGKGVLIGDGGTALLWDPKSRKELRRFGGDSFEVWFDSINGRTVVIGIQNGIVQLWDAASGEELGHFTMVTPEQEEPEFSVMELSPDGRMLLTGSSRDEYLRLWDVASGKELRRFEDSDVGVFSPDGRMLLTGTAFGDENMRLWDVASGKELRRFVALPYEADGLVNNMTGFSIAAFSPNGRRILTIKGGAQRYPGIARVWDTESGEELRRFFPGQSEILAVAFSPNGRKILAVDSNGVARIIDVVSGEELGRLKGHLAAVTDVAYASDGRTMLTGSEDGTARLWDATRGKELCRLISQRNGSWVVTTPDGRFDTNNLEEVKGLHWVMPDEPFRALSLEIFMRDYYEPHLLSRLLAGERLRPIPNLSSLNRVQPLVRIAEIKPQATSADMATVTIEIANATGTFTRDGKQITLESGVYDLRLFRDGQLVGYAPEQDGPIKLESGKATITFKDIKLPRRADLKQVEFSAYAFNVDRVKSETARQTYVLPRPLPSVKGRAYVITVGVNAYENAALDLSFAANDARRLQGVLTEKLKATGEYEEVVPITLLSDYEWKDGRRTITAAQATKGNVKLALDLLAGRPVDPVRLAGIANADKLHPARPEDLVIISFANHGYGAPDGIFYLIPFDTGIMAGFPAQENIEAYLDRCVRTKTSSGKITAECRPAMDYLQRVISSNDLSYWLRDVDGGELVMIVDACQSAAAVEGEGFKPGPMGSRGLGQLAYDKGMRILAATQADNAALEHTLIRQGLLTYALTRDGIELGRADFKPEDKTITLGEWLEYARDRVPQLFAEVRSGQVRSSGPGAIDAPKVILLPQKNAQANQAGATRLFLQGKPIGASGKLTLAEEQIQQPALFDYARKRRDVVLLRK